MADLHVIDITLDIIVTVHLLLQGLTLLYYDITLNLFPMTLFPLPKNMQTFGVDTAFSQYSSISTYTQTGHLFSRPTSQNPSVLSSEEHILNIDLSVDQYSTPPTPNLVDYLLIANNTLVSSPRQDPCFLYFSTSKLDSNTQIFDERRRKDFHRKTTTNLEI